MRQQRESGRFLKGVRYSPTTQFKSGDPRAYKHPKGTPAVNRLPLGSVRIRVETHTGLSRAWVKVAEPNVWRKRAVVNWETVHGPVPARHAIHHKDRDSLNDDIANLACLTLAEHRAEHAQELLDGKRTGH